MYRWTHIDKWTDQWFCSLGTNEKLIFIYFSDHVDEAGFLKLSLKAMLDALKPLTEQEIKNACINISKCYLLSKDRKILFLKNFIWHQQNIPLRKSNREHQEIILKLQANQPFFEQDLFTVITKGIKTTKRVLAVPAGKVPFGDFWLLYGLKIGDTRKCEKIWNSLPLATQNLVISCLPKWKETILLTQRQPYPLTYLNQQRWNDEVVVEKKEGEVKKSVIIFPDNWSIAFYTTHKYNQEILTQYFAKLGNIGYVQRATTRGEIDFYLPQPKSA